jgi:hypothetical protein
VRATWRDAPVACVVVVCLQALLRVDARQMDFFLHPTVDPKAKKTVIAKGLPASPGVGTGELVFNSDEAEALWKVRPLCPPRLREALRLRRQSCCWCLSGGGETAGILSETPLV